MDRPVIKLTRLNGEMVVVNPDLIETLEIQHNVTVALTTGRHITVLETADTIMDAIRHWRQSVMNTYQER